MNITLRDYQEEAVNRTIAAYENDPSGMELLVLPCAAGKTIIFSHIIEYLARKFGTLACVVAHLDELLDQAADKYRFVKPNAVIGKVGSGVYQYGGEVTVAGVQTASRENHLRHLKALWGDGEKLIIVIDEAHLSAANSYQKLLKAFPNAFKLLVTATPYRLDGKRIIDKEPLMQKSILEMIQAGYLCNLKAIAIRTDVDLDNIGTTAGDYNEQELDLAINTPERNRRVVMAYQEHTPGKRAICFGVTVAHCEALAYAFNDFGIKAEAITGNTPLAKRRELYAQFERGEVRVLVSVMVLSIGFDSPRAEVAIMARPTQSQALYVQQAGRVLRLAPGKKCAYLLDITDNALKMRLQPQNFKKAIAPAIQPDEDILEMLGRMEEEEVEEVAKAKRALIRKLNDRRHKDIEFDPFALPEWKENKHGYFVLELPILKHRIALIPCKGNDMLYEVYARLDPDFKQQKWMGAQPLDFAMQFAEKQANMLLADPSSVRIVDASAKWRGDSATENQIKFLKWKKIEIPEGLTKGQASQLIDQWKLDNEKKKKELEEKRAARAAKKAAKAAEKMELLFSEKGA